MDRRGDFRVGRTVIADRRVDSGFSAETLTATKNLLRHSHEWLRLSNDATQDVILPNAEEDLIEGWSQVIDVPVGSAASVKVRTYHGTTPAALKNIVPGRAYRFTCVDNSTPAGEWNINFLEEADLIPTERYVETFDATGDWGSASNGYYTIAVAQTEHERGTKPTVDFFTVDGSDFIQVTPDRVKIAANGDVSFRVPENPNLRFAGEAIFI